MQAKQSREWWEGEGYPSVESKVKMDAKHLPDYKYCILCADGTPKVNHNTFDCINEYDPWYEIPYESFLEAAQKKDNKNNWNGKNKVLYQQVSPLLQFHHRKKEPKQFVRLSQQQKHI